MIYVGIDWADDHHDVAITDDSAKTRAAFQIAHSSEGFAMLHDRLAAFGQPPDQILIAIETARGLMVYELVRSGYVVYAINPKAANRYKDRYVPSKAKSDPLDALSLAHILRTDRHRFSPIAPMPEAYRLLDRLCQDLRKLIDDKSRVQHQIASLLKEFHPRLLDLFSVDSQIFISFARAYPDPLSLRTLTKTQFISFLKTHHYPQTYRTYALWALIETPSPEPDPILMKAGKLHLFALLDQLSCLKGHIVLYEKEIEGILNDLPETPSVKSLPGVGPRLAPELLTLLGPNGSDARFQRSEEIMRLSGCVPVTRQSGKWKTVSMRHACVKSLRRTFHDWAFTSVRQSLWAKAYYSFQKQRNVPHQTILRNLAQKWIRILLAIWRKQAFYDERLYIGSLKRHKVAWAMGL
jgi:transposase